MRRLTALGFLNPGVAYTLGLLGLTSISASMSVLLWATEPVLIMLLAVLLLRQHLAGTLVATTAIAVTGVLLVVDQPGASGSGTGVTLTLAAVAACALYTVVARRLLLDDASVSVVLVQQAAALGCALSLVALVRAVAGDAWDVGSLTPGMWLAAAASGVLDYGLAFWFYLTGLRQVSASVAGSFITLVPVSGVAASYLVGERLTALQWGGAAVVIMAVVAALPARHLRRPDDEQRLRPDPRSILRQRGQLIRLVAAGPHRLGNLVQWNDVAARVKSGDIAVDFARPIDPQIAFLATDLCRAALQFLGRGLPSILIGAVPSVSPSPRARGYGPSVW